MEAKTCISTKKRIDNDIGSVSFMCPSCGKFEIVRSSFARKNAMKYTCPNCGFTGPN
ncbi:RNA-binding protein [archaeon]|jgi:Zn-ribbon RNA-binding protein|nr:RNA-binding protein [archaeon]MBT3451246.1 RNA-binding protein [archaeon]MBT6869101.1 RNA-binding protein [archaeon]MBT7193344.1 RNA-binding protein [archaeon]MBT7380352.1 RNA-binding protein [archaeon]